MIWAFLTGSLVLGIITGVALFSQGSFFQSMGGQIAQGILSLACFALVVIAFWKFGWKIGLLEVFLILVASNLGLSIFKFVNKRIERP